jgi:hypothetical protein
LFARKGKVHVKVKGFHMKKKQKYKESDAEWNILKNICPSKILCHE